MAVLRSARELGELVRARREEAGLSQGELADMAGVGRPFLSRLENGHSAARLQLVLDVLHTLDLELRGVARTEGDDAFTLDDHLERFSEHVT